MGQNNGLAVLLQEHRKEIELLAPAYLNKGRMISIFLEAANSPRIQQCNKLSVLKAAKRMAELGTEIVGAGGAWLVPYKDVLTVIPDWRLIVKKAREAGVIKHATAEAVYDKDVFSYERGMNPNLIHKPSMKRGELVAVYCIYTLPDGSKDFVVMTKDEIDGIRGRSKASSSGPWVSDYEEMAKKTVIRRALKIFEGASSEFAKVIDADNESSGIELAFEPIAEPKAIKAENEPAGEVIDVEPVTQKNAPETPKEAKLEDNGSKVENPFVKTCEDCGESIDSRVADFSMSKYGKMLCRDCQKKNKKTK